MNICDGSEIINARCDRVITFTLSSNNQYIESTGRVHNKAETLQ